MEEKYLEIGDVAKELGKSRATITKYIKSGKLKAQKVKYKRIFKYQIKSDDLQIFKKELE